MFFTVSMSYKGAVKLNKMESLNHLYCLGCGPFGQIAGLNFHSLGANNVSQKGRRGLVELALLCFYMQVVL